MSPIIQTSYGSLRGIPKMSCYEKPYQAFYAIPYAKQPTDECRFKDPRPLEPWEGTLDATKVGAACWNNDRMNPNPSERKIIGSDNCLLLNIYTPGVISEETEEKLLPVMIYIHGGRFSTMSATPFYYGPDYLMDRNIILVTVNYRLGAFGFLSLNDEGLEIPGNAGMKDQVMALKWVQEEIENFGGDPRNVTLFGESAGACSVHLHLLCEQSRGLFKRALIMSGSAFGPWSVRPNYDFAYRLAKALGYEGKVSDEKEIFNVISEADPVRIVQIQDSLLYEEEKFQGQLITFGPVIEPYVTDKTFIPEHPFKTWKNAWGNDIDVIIGGCSKEGLLFNPLVSPETMSSLGNFSHVIAQNAHLDRYSQKCITKGLKLKNFYYGEETPSLENSDIYIDIQGDKNFWHGMWMAMQAYVSAKARTKSKTYLYRFDVAPTSNQTIRKIYQIPHQRGACHVEDVFYVFKAEYLTAPNKDSFEYKVVQIMTGIFAQFARDGNPNSVELGEVIWSPVGEVVGTVKCLNLDEKVSFVEFPEVSRMKLWDEICDENGFSLVQK